MYREILGDLTVLFWFYTVGILNFRRNIWGVVSDGYGARTKKTKLPKQPRIINTAGVWLGYNYERDFTFK